MGRICIALNERLVRAGPGSPARPGSVRQKVRHMPTERIIAYHPPSISKMAAISAGWIAGALRYSGGTVPLSASAASLFTRVVSCSAGGCATMGSEEEVFARALCIVLGEDWLRGQDLNLRPSGYEPDELPGCSTPRHQRKSRSDLSSQRKPLCGLSRPSKPFGFVSYYQRKSGGFVASSKPYFGLRHQRKPPCGLSRLR